jgi:LuxR family maltose regulon positive regulatory protein
LSGFSPEQAGGDARLALVGAGAAFVMGDLAEVQSRQTAAARALEGSPDSGAADELEAVASLLGSAAESCEPGAVALAARTAREAIPKDRPWYPIACFLEGAGLHLSGHHDRAESVLEDGARRGAVAAHSPQALCLAQLALMAAERGDWEGAAALVARARRAVERPGVRDYPSSALVFAAAAAIRARRGQVTDAQKDVRRCLRLTEEIVDFAPWYLAEVRLALAQARLRLSDVPGARDLVAAAARDVRRVGESDVIRGWMAAVEEDAEAAASSGLPTSLALTTAELRILRFLPTHLSFREIAGNLYVSGNTVKTQAHAVYRKLGASSRSQAVAKAAELGLIDV